MKSLLLLMLSVLLAGSNPPLYQERENETSPASIYEDYIQELTKAKDWKRVYYIDGGIYALKKDGSLWEFSKIEKTYRENLKKQSDKIYHLQPQEVITNGRVNMEGVSVEENRIYMIVSGILMALGREIGYRNEYFEFPTYIDSIGAFKQWREVKTTGSQERGQCVEQTLGFTSDGTLYAISNQGGNFFTFLKDKYYPKAMGREWFKVLMGCNVDYGMKKDGSIWRWSLTRNNLQKVTNKKVKRKVRKRMADMIKGLAIYDVASEKEGSYEDNTKGILADGSLWLLPI